MLGLRFRFRCTIDYEENVVTLANHKKGTISWAIVLRKRYTVNFYNDNNNSRFLISQPFRLLDANLDTQTVLLIFHRNLEMPEYLTLYV